MKQTVIMTIIVVLATSCSISLTQPPPPPPPPPSLLQPSPTTFFSQFNPDDCIKKIYPHVTFCIDNYKGRGSSTSTSAYAATFEKNLGTCFLLDRKEFVQFKSTDFLDKLKAEVETQITNSGVAVETSGSGGGDAVSSIHIAYSKNNTHGVLVMIGRLVIRNGNPQYEIHIMFNETIQ